MFSIVRRQALIVLCLMTFLVCGAVAAEAGSTHGADRTLKGAVAGAAIGTVTQVVRGRTTGKEILKGAALGGVIGAGVGAYSDYTQEKSAREKAERQADYYQYGNNRAYYGNGRAVRARNLRYSGPLTNAPYYAQNGRGRGKRHCN
jgi:uncharacterized membrane protein YebE (DUF533 family)